LAFGSKQGFSVILGHGDGTFSAPAYYAIGAISGIAGGDFNGDRKLDLAVAVDLLPGDNSILVYLGNGDGTFIRPLVGPEGSRAGWNDFLVANEYGAATVPFKDSRE
jgi:hypothetical protein